MIQNSFPELYSLQHFREIRLFCLILMNIQGDTVDIPKLGDIVM